MRILTADIVAGVRRTGEMLPKEVDLAAEFDVSRGVARETIRAMEERGLVTVKHGKGATINAPDSWDVFDADVLAATLDTDQGVDVLKEYLECRRILEVEAAGLAAERATKAHIKQLAEAVRRMEETTVRPSGQAAEELFHESDIAFHQALIAATGNRPLAGLVERLHSALLLARYPLARPQYRIERALPEHRRIFDAVSDGDAGKARAAMSDHLDTIAGYLDEYRRGKDRRRAAPPNRSGRS
ncbi:MAG TPA: FadR/GntR family transcriptional regulator [Solirubrobacterales bacterium]|jgi:GntR family transcriptional repressor for pyruvate dehydrogenase complex